MSTTFLAAAATTPGLFSNAPQPNAPSITTSLLLVKAISSILVNHLSLMMTQNKTNLNLFSPYSLNLSITISIKFSKYLGISNFTIREIAI